MAPLINAMKAEDKLLYLCSIPHRPIEPETSARLISQITSWEPLLEKTAYHKLQPRLYSFLKRNGAPSLLEASTWKKIESTYLWARAYTLGLEAELTHVLLPRFNEAGIDILLLKGSAFLYTVYREKPVRFFGDLDFLIHSEDLENTQALLKEWGYHTAFRSHFPTAWHDQEIGSQLRPNAFNFFHPEKEFHLDVHVEVFDELAGFRLERDWLWKDAQIISVDGIRALVPEPSRLFLHLLFHLAKHIGMRQNFFGWYLDLDECLRYFGDKIDGGFCWQEISKTAYADKLLQILAFIHAHFSSPIPQELRFHLAERNIAPFSLQEVFLPPEKLDLSTFNEAGWLDRRELFLRYWDKARGLRKKIWFLLRWIFPDPNYLKAKYAFESLPQKIVAYLTHFIVTTFKGIGLGFYLLRLKTSRKLILLSKEDKFV